MTSTSTTNPSMEKPRLLTNMKRFICYAIFIIFPIVIFHLIHVYKPFPFNPTTLSSERFTGSHVVDSMITSSNEPSSTSSSPSTTPGTSSDDSSSIMVTSEEEDHGEKVNIESTSCNYSYGKWIPSDLGPLYNDTSCSVKDEQKCLSNGRPNTNYLYWRWKPSKDGCELPRFDPEAFLTLMTGKHLAFVGDSIARNQAESLICMLSSLYHPIFVSSHRSQVHEYARWHFSSHNVNISMYWSPYLMKGKYIGYHMIDIDIVDETWASDIGSFDMLVLSAGHWFQVKFVIYEGGLEVGCYDCNGLNHTEVSIGATFGKALRNALNAIFDQRKASNDDHTGRNSIDVIVTTFSPHHFEGLWYEGADCPKTEPYEESNVVGTSFEQMRKVVVDAVNEARATVMNMGLEVKARITTLDITKLSWLRPDAHPGSYLHPFPSANKTSTNSQDTRNRHDCVHWCLPGAIDTWNEIMLEIIKNWQIGRS